MESVTLRTLQRVEKFLQREPKPISIWGIHKNTGWRWISIKNAITHLVEEGKVIELQTESGNFYKVKN